MSTVIIMAGGTGGHIYPALAVGTALRERGVTVCWMGVHNGLEAKLAQEQGFEFDSVRTQGLWGKGISRWMTMPLWLSMSIIQCIGIILRRRPDLLLGMGGYVCGPGGLASWLLRRPLVIHESNVIPGLTNRVLAVLATRILTGFSEAKLAGKPVWVGTPVRKSIIEAGRNKEQSDIQGDRPLNLLIIGGSQGAKALNECIPEALSMLPEEMLPNIRHQSGSERGDDTKEFYRSHGVRANVSEYIEDMAEAYQWADVIVARSGAMSLAEISTVGLATVLVPFPYAARDHQQVNADIYEQKRYAFVCREGENFVRCLVEHLKKLLGDRDLIKQMSMRIKDMAKMNSTELVVENCMEVMQ